jgi:hypothetical protein
MQAGQKIMQEVESKQAGWQQKNLKKREVKKFFTKS